VPGATVERRRGYVAVTLELTGVPAGLSPRAAALIEAFPVGSNGLRVVHVDVRNRQWAALVVEIATALGRP
jgi:hypothetical protein